jgi:hypothetical protein
MVWSQPGQIVFETLSWENLSQRRAGGVAQGSGPEFKPQYKKKKKKVKRERERKKPHKIYSTTHTIQTSPSRPLQWPVTMLFTAFVLQYWVSGISPLWQNTPDKQFKKRKDLLWLMVSEILIHACSALTWASGNENATVGVWVRCCTSVIPAT